MIDQLFPFLNILNLSHRLMPHHRNVVVIGAGAGGLAAGHFLRQEGHKVTIFEKQKQVGGTWIYTPETKPDPLSKRSNRRVVHSSIYESLRTNLPREEMGFRFFPFLVRPGRDSRMYLGHAEVLRYLMDFAKEFEICDMVRFGTEVKRVGMEDGRWRVRSKIIDGGDEFDEDFDAAVVCNRHYTEPRIAEISGIESWPGKQMHSHNYRVPEPFKGQVVVFIGSAASAVDISREIAEGAKEVHIASRSINDGASGKVPGFTNFWLHDMIERVHEDGTGFSKWYRSSSGYHYALHRILPFPLFELQSKWIAGVLSGSIKLPSSSEMMADVESFYERMEASGIPKNVKL